MTTDNRTIEQLAELIRQFAEAQAMDFDSPHVAMTLNEVADRLASEPTDEQVEAAAKAIWERYAGHGPWETLPPERKSPFLKDARAALVAARGAGKERTMSDNRTNSKYTPNTESVRESIVYLAKYHAERQHCDADLVVVESEVQGQFDRWLAEVERKAAQKGWDQGFEAGWAECSDPGAFVNDLWDAKTPNPYGLTAEQEG